MFQVAHSGTTVWRSATMTEMLAEAKAGAFDLLLAGYSDRWQRNLRRTLELLEDGLHPAGVALVMCDRRILSSDPHDWDELISEAAGAEKYSRRLSERITDGYAAKFDHRDDPGGHAGLGFRRLPEPPHTLEIDPATIGTAVGLFERYALGNVSAKDLAEETGLAEQPDPDDPHEPALQRLDPPPPTEPSESRASRRRGARTRPCRTSSGRGSRTSGEARPGAAGREAPRTASTCSAGSSSASAAAGSGTTAPSRDGRHRKLHVDPCEAWGRKARLGDEIWEEPILAQVAGIDARRRHDRAVVAVLGSTRRPVEMDRARIDRRIRELALEHAAGRLEDAAYLERLQALREARTTRRADGGSGSRRERAIEWLRAIVATSSRQTYRRRGQT